MKEFRCLILAGESYQRFIRGQGWLGKVAAEEDGTVEIGPGQAVFIYTDGRDAHADIHRFGRQMPSRVKCLQTRQGTASHGRDATGALIWWRDITDCGWPWEDQSAPNMCSATDGNPA